tara:strand:- start:21947 stop:22549 length:603 start_codon:yes stop_codon:yes gene_type:complete
MLSGFPILSSSEFHAGCLALEERFSLHGTKQHEWISVENVQEFDAKFLRITKDLSNHVHADADEDELSEHDDEALETEARQHAVIHHDIVLSPTYRVPVLYISIVDPLHRYPPTMAALYEHLIPPPYKEESGHAGIIGGITVTDHPVTGRPAFFIHPCRTTEVMTVIVGKEEVTAEEYLMIWIGALGRCVGLDIPLALMQ